MALVETLSAKPPPLRTDTDGVVRVGETRVTLDTVIGTFNNGCDPVLLVRRASLGPFFGRPSGTWANSTPLSQR
jgi:hypothetical protein